ncbi:type II toxin-antitoxin system death-on-curing family toxin [Methylobacter svalbardensis]|uniref:type II toxin-antitoxin system death-on-curing family toxin n=1 Tax=Methylobacter svalbardensis TaxID=3080016 RepID=UPI0030EBC26D
MSWQWISAELALAIHQRQLAEHSGLSGIRDKGLLDSALARPQNLHAYGENDLYALAAAYGFGIARNHPFNDGNKRTAYIVTRLFLKLHDNDMPGTPENRVRIFEQLAAGNITEPELVAWLKNGGA